jgi:hypothetical protein
MQRLKSPSCRLSCSLALPLESPLEVLDALHCQLPNLEAQLCAVLAVTHEVL